MMICTIERHKTHRPDLKVNLRSDTPRLNLNHRSTMAARLLALASIAISFVSVLAVPTATERDVPTSVHDFSKRVIQPTTWNPPSNLVTGLTQVWDHEVATYNNALGFKNYGISFRSRLPTVALTYCLYRLRCQINHSFDILGHTETEHLCRFSSRTKAS